MDGVVVDGMQFHARAWQDVFATHLGIDLPRLWVYEWEGIPGQQFLGLVASRLGRQFSPALITELHELKRKHFDEIFQITPIDGINETIQWLKITGYPLALVTGTGRDVAQRVLARLGLSSAFDHIVGGDDVTRGKPYPEPYLKAARLAGFEPVNSLVIENAPAGIEAALQAGMTCVALTTSLGEEYLQKANCVLPDHAALRALLATEHARSGGLGAWQLL
jgi:HAD superfamily hydrolase (TIGR01509 family)